MNTNPNAPGYSKETIEVTQQTFNIPHEIFKRYDRNSQGNIGVSDLRTAINDSFSHNSLPHPANNDVSQLLERYQYDGDKRITYEEFHHLIQDLKGGSLVGLTPLSHNTGANSGERRAHWEETFQTGTNNQQGLTQNTYGQTNVNTQAYSRPHVNTDRMFHRENSGLTAQVYGAIPTIGFATNTHNQNQTTTNYAQPIQQVPSTVNYTQAQSTQQVPPIVNYNQTQPQALHSDYTQTQVTTNQNRFVNPDKHFGRENSGITAQVYGQAPRYVPNLDEHRNSQQSNINIDFSHAPVTQPVNDFRHNPVTHVVPSNQQQQQVTTTTTHHRVEQTVVAAAPLINNLNSNQQNVNYSYQTPIQPTNVNSYPTSTNTSNYNQNNIVTEARMNNPIPSYQPDQTWYAAVPSNYAPKIYPISKPGLKRAEAIFRRHNGDNSGYMSTAELENITNEVLVADNQGPVRREDLAYLLYKYGFDQNRKITFREYKRMLKELSGTKSFDRNTFGIFKYRENTTVQPPLHYNPLQSNVQYNNTNTNVNAQPMQPAHIEVTPGYTPPVQTNTFVQPTQAMHTETYTQQTQPVRTEIYAQQTQATQPVHIDIFGQTPQTVQTTQTVHQETYVQQHPNIQQTFVQQSQQLQHGQVVQASPLPIQTTLVTAPIRTPAFGIVLPPNYVPKTYPLSPEAIDYSKNSFLRHDINRNGYLDVNELQVAIADIYTFDKKLPPANEDIAFLLSKHDFDIPRSINTKEFKRLLKELSGTKGYTKNAFGFFRKIFSKQQP